MYGQPLQYFLGYNNFIYTKHPERVREVVTRKSLRWLFFVTSDTKHCMPWATLFCRQSWEQRLPPVITQARLSKAPQHWSSSLLLAHSCACAKIVEKACKTVTNECKGVCKCVCKCVCSWYSKAQILKERQRRGHWGPTGFLGYVHPNVQSKSVINSAQLLEQFSLKSAS